jgi:hypothetical protein
MDLPVWLAVLLGLPAALGFMRVMDVLAAIPINIRKSRVYSTPCPACGNPFDKTARWQIQHPDYNVECASCRAVCTFDARGRLKRATSRGVGLA